MENILAHENLDYTTLSKYIDINDYILFYWIQEFSKNKDGAFSTSVYFTWENGQPLSMGPVWDFDLAYGGNFGGDVIPNGKWYIRNFYWNKRLFQEKFFIELVNDFWKKKSNHFYATIDSITFYKTKLDKPAYNNFKRWDILKSTSNIWHNISFNSYDSAIDSLIGWINHRINWIEDNLVQSTED